MAQRYDVISDEYTMCEYSDGKWVKYEDFAKIMRGYGEIVDSLAESMAELRSDITAYRAALHRCLYVLETGINSGSEHTRAVNAARKALKGGKIWQ